MRSRLLCSCIGFATLLAICCVVQPDIAIADTPSPQESSPQEALQLQEVTVTAQKREERLLDVPISIVALSGQELAARNITSIDDLAAGAVPGLSIASSGGGYQRRVYLRGIANTFGTSQVGIYLDDIDMTVGSISQLAVATYDLTRIEVLRGPQGTLYGDGAMGGTVRFITADPDLSHFSSTTDAAFSFTQDGSPSHRIGEVINLPLVDQELGVRLSGVFEHDGGWIDQPAVGRDNYNQQDVSDFRLKTLWHPISAFTANLTALIHRNETGSVNTGEDSSGNLTQSFGLPTTPVSKDDFEIYGLTLVYDFSRLRLQNTASYINQNQVARNIPGQIPFSPPGAPNALVFDLYTPIQPLYADYFNDEFRATSSSTGPWEWTVGAFYRHDRTSSEGATFIFALPNASPIPPPSSFGSRTEDKSEAVFGDVNYKIAGRLTIGAGLRYFHDETAETVAPYLSGTSHALSPRFYVQYKVTDQISLYSSAAKGFRSGGTNPPPEPPYLPEAVWTYELGSKMTMLHGRLSVDGAVFYSNYSDYQIFGIGLNPNGSQQPGRVTNAGDAKIKGVEWDVSWQPTEKWLLSASGNYLDSYFTSIDLLPSSASYAVGDPLPVAVKYTVTESVSRNFRLFGRDGFMRLDFAQIGPSTYRNRVIGPWYYSESDVIHMLNLDISLQLNENLSMGLFCQNLVNDRGYTDPFSIEGDASRSRPKTVGLKVSAKFE